MADARDEDRLEVQADDPVREMVHDHPLVAVLTAFALGLLLAKFAF